MHCNHDGPTLLYEYRGGVTTSPFLFIISAGRGPATVYNTLNQCGLSEPYLAHIAVYRSPTSCTRLHRIYNIPYAAHLKSEHSGAFEPSSHTSVGGFRTTFPKKRVGKAG